MLSESMLWMVYVGFSNITLANSSCYQTQGSGRNSPRYKRSY